MRTCGAYPAPISVEKHPKKLNREAIVYAFIAFYFPNASKPLLRLGRSVDLLQLERLIRGSASVMSADAQAASSLKPRVIGSQQH